MFSSQSRSTDTTTQALAALGCKPGPDRLALLLGDPKPAIVDALTAEVERHSESEARKAFGVMMRPPRGSLVAVARRLLEDPEVFRKYTLIRRRAVTSGQAPSSFVAWFVSDAAAKVRAPFVRAAHGPWLERELEGRRARQQALFQPSAVDGFPTAGVVTPASFESFAGGAFERLAPTVGFSGLTRVDVARMLEGDVDPDAGHMADVLAWSEQPHDESMFLVLAGSPGAGKTFPAITWLSMVRERHGAQHTRPGDEGRYAVTSRNLVDILRTERMGIPPRSNPSWGRGGWDLLMSARALVIDEVFQTDEKMGEEREVLHEVVNARRVGDGMRTIITTNRTWETLANPRRGLADATLSRLHGVTAVRENPRQADLRRRPPSRTGRDVLHERFVKMNPCPVRDA
jgi:hypothetical protein